MPGAFDSKYQTVILVSHPDLAGEKIDYMMILGNQPACMLF